MKWASGCLAAAIVFLLCAATAGAAGSADATALAKRYAPVMELKRQTKPCDHRGEGYRPTSVDVTLGNPDVRLLRAPLRKKAKATVLKQGPTAEDIAGLGSEYYLDLLGRSLHPGCHYERLSKQLTPAFPPLTYAHIVREPGVHGIAIQYWFYWLYNQFTDLHESDWEMIQVEFPVDTVAAALKTQPSGLAYAQHAGGERAGWTDDNVHKEGTRPIVYPGAGSHASYYGSEIYLGNGKSGFGCDNTTGPSDRLPLVPQVVPTDPGLKGSDAWLTFDGRWGERQPKFYNGPTGPNAHRQWRAPFTWSRGLRTDAPSVPAGTTLGPDASSAFCSAVTHGSKVLLFAVSSRPLAIAALVLLLGLIGLGIHLTRWDRIDPLPLGQPARAGEILRATVHLYERDRWAYVRIGLLFIPAIVLAGVISALLLSIPGIDALSAVVGGQIVDFVLTTGIGFVFVGAAFALTYAAVAAALLDADAGRDVTALGAYRSALGRLRTLAAVSANVVFGVAILSLTVFGIPLAVHKAVDWAFATPEAMIENESARAALRRTSEMVKGRWWSTFAFVAVVLAFGIVSGATIGVLLIAATSLSLPLVNAVGSVVYVLTIPYCAIALTLKRYAMQGPGTPPQNA